MQFPGVAREKRLHEIEEVVEITVYTVYDHANGRPALSFS